MLLDQPAREQALNPEQSFIVQAPAGSGKTGLLVRRVLALLGGVEKPEEILAITFTRKATAEMRERVLGALNKANNGIRFKPHERDMEVHAHAALARNHEKQWRLLSQPQRLKIQTIDSLCAELVRKMPWSTRFGGMPQIETDLETLYAQAAQNLIQKIDDTPLQADLGTLLIYSNGDLQTLQTRLTGMLYQREEWLRLIFTHKALASREQIEQHWLGLMQRSIEELEQVLGRGLSQELLELARYAEQHRPDEATPLADDQLSALYDDSHLPDLRTRAIRWQLIENMVNTGTGDFRKSVNKNNGFPLKDGAKTRLLEILAGLQDDIDAQIIFQQFRHTPCPKINDVEWARLQALKSVLPALAQELYVMMAERNCADYDELSQRAIDALGEPDQPSNLALIQNYRIKHILMDEFQDTSPAQLQLLERLTAGWQSDDRGRSVFLVGDPMQSIYGFRKADVRVFLKVRDSGINDIRLHSLELKVNFRSSPDIVSWVNQTMHSVFPDIDVPELARVKYSPSTAYLAFSGAIHTHLCVAERSQQADDYRYCEAHQIIKHIHDFRELYPGDSIAVLARKRAPLAALAECLRESEIAFESVDLETLAEQSIIQDLIVLCGIFLQPMDTLAWLAVLRAPWCGLSLNDLTVLRDLGLPVFEILQKEVLPEGLSDTGARTLNRTRSRLLPLVEAGQRLELNERLRRAWLGLRGPACFATHELVHVEPFFDMLLTLESELRGLNRERLQQACKLHKSSSPANPLKLMTFHKAKGLEFDHVILTGLAGKSGGDNRQQPLLFSAQIDHLQLLAPAPLANEKPPTKSGFIKQYRKSIDDEEATRLLYVAVTRARKQLSLFATLKRNTTGELSVPQRGSLLHLLWPELSSEFERSEFQSEVSGADKMPDKHNTKPAGIPLLSLPFSLDSLKLPAAILYPLDTVSAVHSQIEFSWAQEDARIIGLVVHQILERADLSRVKSWKNSIDEKSISASLSRNGLIAKRVGKAGQRVKNVLRSMSTDERAHWLFDPDHRDSRSEWALSCLQDGHIANYIIDRSFIDENGIRWIVDFKTSRHEGSNLNKFLNEEEQRYATQLEQYAQLVRFLEPELKIRLGLYFPAIGEWREREYLQ